MARAGTPPAIIHKVSLTLQAILNEPAVRARFETLGVYPLPKSPAETAQFIRPEQQLWKPVIKEAGLILQ